MFYIFLYLANRQARKARLHRSPAMAMADNILMAVVPVALGLTILVFWLTS